MESTITSSPHHRNTHFVLIPWFAQGHMIPMIDIARLLAHRGITVTLVTTPVNLARIKPTVDRIQESKLPIRFVPLPFPCARFGLPEGCENFDCLPSRSLMANFHQAAKALKQPLADHLRALDPNTPSPTCIIADFGHSWTKDVAHELSVPRLVFNGYNCFALLCKETLAVHRTDETVSSDTDTFLLPGLPQQIEFTRQQMPMLFQASVPPQFEQTYKELRESEVEADGIVVNSFDELEVGYAKLLEKYTGKHVWMIGPVSLCNGKGSKDLAERGNKASIDGTRCKGWLDSMSPRSVVYVCFGSMGTFGPSQLIELGSGLLASNRPFIWVINGPQNPEVEEWLSENFSDESRCIVIRGWAPQAMILGHEAVGGFVTHCGWNSTLEGVCVGLPLLTWPLFAEQFFNERLVVDVLRIGVSVGVKRQTSWGADVKDEVVAGRGDVAVAVGRLMEERGEGGERRRRVEELAKLARRATDDGGSSHRNLTMLIRYALNYQAGKNAAM